MTVTNTQGFMRKAGQHDKLGIWWVDVCKGGMPADLTKQHHAEVFLLPFKGSDFLRHQVQVIILAPVVEQHLHCSFGLRTCQWHKTHFALLTTQSGKHALQHNLLTLTGCHKDVVQFHGCHAH